MCGLCFVFIFYFILICPEKKYDIDFSGTHKSDQSFQYLGRKSAEDLSIFLRCLFIYNSSQSIRYKSNSLRLNCIILQQFRFS